MGPWTSQKEINCICKVWHHSERGETLKLKSGSSNVTESVTSVKERGGNSLPKLKSSYFGRISQQLCSFVRWRHPIRRDWLAFLPWLGQPYLTTPYHPSLLKRLTQLFENSGSNITKFQFLGLISLLRFCHHSFMAWTITTWDRLKHYTPGRWFPT